MFLDTYVLSVPPASAVLLKGLLGGSHITLMVRGRMIKDVVTGDKGHRLHPEAILGCLLGVGGYMYIVFKHKKLGVMLLDVNAAINILNIKDVRTAFTPSVQDSVAQNRYGFESTEALLALVAL